MRGEIVRSGLLLEDLVEGLNLLANILKDKIADKVRILLFESVHVHHQLIDLNRFHMVFQQYVHASWSLCLPV